MKENFYRSGNYHVDHRTYGGSIYPSDFDRKTTLSDMAARILADRKFDQQYQKIALQLSQSTACIKNK